MKSTGTAALQFAYHTCHEQYLMVQVVTYPSSTTSYPVPGHNELGASYRKFWVKGTGHHG